MKQVKLMKQCGKKYAISWIAKLVNISVWLAEKKPEKANDMADLLTKAIRSLVAPRNHSLQTRPFRQI